MDLENHTKRESLLLKRLSKRVPSGSLKTTLIIFKASGGGSFGTWSAKSIFNLAISFKKQSK